MIILTSNVGTRQLKDFGRGIGFAAQNRTADDKEYARSVIQKALNKTFSPEFLNRLDEIITFDQLTLDAITRIYLLRLRYQMRIAYRNQTRRHLMVEEVVPWALVGANGQDQLDLERAQYLLVNAPIGGNFSAPVAQGKIEEAIALYTQHAETLNAFAQRRAAQISAAHRGEMLDDQQAPGETKRHKSSNVYLNDGSVVEVKVCDPIDLIGVYVLLPDLDSL